MKNNSLSKLFLLSILALMVLPATAQRKSKRDRKDKKRPVLNEPVYYVRNSYHYRIDEIQKKIDLFDGIEDTLVYYTADDEENTKLMKVVFWGIDDEQILIENDVTDNRQKIIDLNNLEKVTDIYYNMLKNHELNKDDYAKLLNNYSEILEARRKGNLDQYVDRNHSREVVELAFLLDEDAISTTNLMGWYATNYPKSAMEVMKKSWDKPYADTLVSILGPKNRVQFLSYARAGGVTQRVIARNNNPEVKIIYKIATQSQTKNVFKNYLFYDKIADGTMSIQEADRISNDDANYFTNLVKYRMDNSYLSNTKTILAEIKIEALQRFVRVINELHEKPASVRFKSIQGLTPAQLYYTAISGSDEIYTSSFMGLYKIMMNKLDNVTTDKLLEQVHYDRFRTFIRMASGYNVINSFLSHMPDKSRDKLLVEFVSNLEKKIDENGLEDAVDVADSYASLKDSSIQAALRQEVEKEYQRVRRAQNTEGMAIYSILLTVMDGKSKLTQGEIVSNLPPVLDMPIDQMKDTNGQINAVMFFYGDEDGRGSFNTYLGRLPSSQYSRVNKKYWVEFTSKKNPDFHIYINQPLPEPEDEMAQKAMMKHLHDNGIHPSLLIHRGHSYHVPLSIDQMEPSNKVVVLGSCGGYHNLKSILTNTEQAQIVSSKQTGVGVVNNRIIDEIFATLSNSKSIEWIPLWEDVKKQLKPYPEYVAYFEDYIPPYQNLGAIFMISYKRMVGNTDY